ncbi:MAG: class I tRNA ligase family protein, partial [Aeriscardovia sp.]|nr:class I tRNA ligase family protein [Aeriscardovia sp.]
YRGDESARNALRIAIDAILALFAPFLPFVTEEAWHWAHPEGLSVHLSAWPEPAPTGESPEGFREAALCLSMIRKQKSEKKASLKTEVESATIFGRGAAAASIAACDLKAAVHAKNMEFIPGEGETGAKVEF